MVRRRREWRALAIAIGVTAAVVLVSFVLSPSWLDWIAFLLASPGRSEMLVVRLRSPLCSSLRAATGRRWLVPVAVWLSLPVVWINSWVILLAIIRLRDPGAADHGHEPDPHAVAVREAMAAPGCDPAAVVGAALGLETLLRHVSTDPFADTRLYYDAGARLNAGLPLYLDAVAGCRPVPYANSPLLAIAFRPLALLPFAVAAAIWETVLLAAFVHDAPAYRAPRTGVHRPGVSGVADPVGAQHRPVRGAGDAAADPRNAAVGGVCR